MTFPNDRARELWARTRVHVWPEPYVLVSLPVELAVKAAAAAARARPAFAATVLERDEVSLTLPETTWRSDPLRDRERAEAGPFRVLSFDLDLDLDVCGYLAPAAAALAAAEVPIVPQCAYLKDHLLVPAEKLDAALAALEALIAEARNGR
ncbi:MAG: ACT domain-containing protein [Acidobacteria bacterium]|jgi:hypothetical protein|nr:ACT domain-containing protein [Acidobacteriota bacterium]